MHVSDFESDQSDSVYLNQALMRGQKGTWCVHKQCTRLFSPLTHKSLERRLGMARKKKLESAKVSQRRQRCVDLNEVFVCVQYVRHIAKRDSCKW